MSTYNYQKLKYNIKIKSANKNYPELFEEWKFDGLYNNHTKSGMKILNNLGFKLENIKLCGCGKKHIKYCFVIYNKITKKNMIIGSSCIIKLREKINNLLIKELIIKVEENKQRIYYNKKISLIKQELKDPKTIYKFKVDNLVKTKDKWSLIKITDVKSKNKADLISGILKKPPFENKNGKWHIKTLYKGDILYYLTKNKNHIVFNINIKNGVAYANLI